MKPGTMAGRIISGEADDSDSRKRRRRLAAAERAVAAWEAAHAQNGVVTYSPIDLVEASCFDEIKKALRGCVTYDRRTEILTLHFRYPYQVDLATVREPIHLLGWITHLLKKSWMTTKYAVAVIERVAEIRKWDVHPPAGGLAYKTVKPRIAKKRRQGPHDSAWWS